LDEALYYGSIGDSLYIKAEGHVTAARCPELKALAFARLDASPPPASVIVDLGSCEYMDSTFLGLLVGLTKRLLRVSGKPITLRGANATCQGLLKVIGVTRLVEISAEPPAPPEGLQRVGGGRASAEFLIEAHEELAEISPENRDRFGSLLGVLKGSLKKDGDGKER
jgi:anti-anti-sigma factor